jgi:AcrR family transcriptional regulator
MPRHLDPDVERRIIRAAIRLWHEGGEKALSMRTIAKAAGTHTPAVYRRFRNREDITRALVVSFQQQLFKLISPCGSMPEIAKAYLKFALRRPREYELIMSGLLAKTTPERPNLGFALGRVAQWLGGTQEDHEALVCTLSALLHGCASLIISGVVPQAKVSKLMAGTEAAVEILLADEARLRKLGATT